MRREVDLALKFTDDKVCDKDFYKKVVKLQQAIKDLGWEINSIDTNITNE